MSAHNSVVISIATPDDMHALGQRLASQLRAGDVVVLTGPLGAGKTTLTQGVGQGLGVTQQVTSPTFVVSRVHRGGTLTLVHVDAYRLTSATDVDELDLDIHGPHVLFMEWGKAFVADLVDSWLDIEISRDDLAQDEDDQAGGVRTVTLTAYGSAWADRPLEELTC